MKKYILILVLLSYVLIFSPIARADYASSYQSYVSSNGIYQNTYNAYLTARSTYLASGSLDSEDKAMQATIKMLQARDNLTTNFLNAINTKIVSTEGISGSDQNSFGGQINTEISWYNNHSSRIPSAGSLSDLVNDSDEAKTQFQNSTQSLIYRSAITLGAGNNSFIRGELSSEIDLLRAKIDEIKANQDKDVSIIERSIVEVQNKISRSQGKDSEAIDLINATKPNDKNQITNNFQVAQTDLTDSNSYLKEANQGLLQIITQIKTN
jgi:hypothetical protein